MRLITRSICLLLISGALFAQSDKGTITGTVADPVGALVPGATVEARNIETGAQYQTATTSTGNYTLAQLPAGVYQLTASASGFKKFTRQGITVHVAQVVRIDVPLEVGAITKTVTVTEDAPPLKTESGELSHIVSSERMDQLPMLGIGATAAGSSGIRSATNDTSSVVRRIGRPGGIPFQGFDVSFGHMTARFSPVDLRFRSICRFSPSPNERRRRMATVPQGSFCRSCWAWMAACRPSPALWKAAQKASPMTWKMYPPACSMAPRKMA